MSLNPLSSHKQASATASNRFPLDYKSLYESKEMSDIQFLFQCEGEPNSQGQKKKKIEHRILAHKLILASQSPVFKAMFYGPLAEKDEIIINDVPLEVFDSMLRYAFESKHTN